MSLPLTPNNKGKFKKEDVIKAGYQIIDYGVTATEIERELGIKLTMEQRLKHCIGFRCERGWRGCVPVFDLLEIAVKASNGEL